VSGRASSACKEWTGMDECVRWERVVLFMEGVESRYK
jgi:hypothetical protein